LKLLIKQKTIYMKSKLIFSLAALLIVAASLQAQFTIGIKGGANVGKVDGKSFKEQFRYGYHIGGFAEIGLGKKFMLQPEVLYNQYSTRLDSNYKAIYQNIIDPANATSIKLNYLSIPIILSYKFLGPISLQAGPQFGILIDQNKSFLKNGEAAFKNGDFSMLAGAQVKLGKLRVTGRYVIGLSNINDIDDKDKWKSQALQLSLGLTL
jgi:hypothetical protein